MHGLIAKFTAHPGQRDEVAALMVSGGTPPGCRSFVVATDPQDPDALWITEVWDSEAAWAASFDLPAVQASIDRVVPLVAVFGEPTVTVPVAILP
jgi:quinol monooxygenase YgiN